ncbi:KIR protein [Plasmodium coatneyi]|uniref:KIR protein n=1 Tax=Plasmodium coatneyi TaxID=208452 RepID=A0A1B1DWX2_9APIC|nr:KIR protein [Plasmodium coatneyi]ANQ07107.1 KIR protein [Plasmodium coatneyi]
MTNLNLRELPSKAAYAAFDAGWGPYSGSCDWLNSTKTALESALGGHESVQSYIEKISKAWCIVQNSEGKRLAYSPYCIPFYYWLGNILFNTLSGVVESPLEIMKKIYEKLNEVPNNKDKCEIIYELSDKDTFNEMKAVYEYSQDQYKIKQQLKKTSKECTLTYQKHLQNSVSAYNSLNTKCGSSTDTSIRYCETFKRQYKTQLFDGDKLSQLTCNIISEEEPAHTVEQPLSQSPINLITTGSNTPIITPIISSSLAAIGLPAVAAFFLYKYNLLPTWISKKFKGGSNRSTGRRSAIGKNFDAFTEGDSSTEYSTENSTLGSAMDSSIGILTEYNRRGRRPPPTNGGRANTNNRRPQKNIAYQNM